MPYVPLQEQSWSLLRSPWGGGSDRGGHIVRWRKKCFGMDSEAGSRFVERILSTMLSLRVQQRDVFKFLVQAREAAVHDLKPPSLCPTS